MVVMVSLTAATTTPSTDLALGRGASRRIWSVQGRTRSPRSSSSQVRPTCTVTCEPFTATTFTSPTVLVLATRRCLLFGWVSQPSGRKTISLSPTRARPSCLKWTYAVSYCASICFSSNEASRVPASAISCSVTRPDERTSSTEGGLNESRLDLLTTPLAAACSSAEALMVRSGPAGGAEGASGSSLASSAAGGCPSGPGIGILPPLEALADAASTCAGPPPAPACTLSLFPG